MSHADSNRSVWVPTADHLDNAHVLELVRALRLTNYDALRTFSLSNPAEYWNTVLDFLEISWSVRPGAYVKLDRGLEFPDWFPDGELNWVDTVLARAAKGGNATGAAVVAESEDGRCARVSFAELSDAVRRFATGLRLSGVKRGDRIGLLMENGVEATVSMLALSYIGAIAVPLFSGFGVEAIISRLSSSGARGLISTTGFVRRGRYVDVAMTVREALRQLPALDLLIWKGGQGARASDAVAWESLASTPQDGSPAARMSANDPFMIIYTSGTTGKPKGAVHTHGGFPLKIAHDSAVHFDIGPGDVFCWPADMGWIAGTLVLCSALLRGATLVCYDGAPDYPDWSRMSRLIERHRVTHFGSAPTLIRGLASNVPASLAGDRATVQLMITAGEGIDPDHFTWFRTKFGTDDTPLINYTGGTEVSGALLSSVIVKPIKAAGFNTASPAVDVAVVDASGKAVLDAPGELAIRAPFVGMTRSFWQDDERYLETYWRSVPGMWIHGDLALQTADGDYFMLGRSDDTIKLAGKRLGPAEVEEILLELAEVHEAAAIGVADAAKGEKLVVFVVPGPGLCGEREALADRAMRHVELRLGKPFRPNRVYLVGELPKTRSSKVMRRVIKRICAQQPLGDLSALDNPSAIEQIRSAISASA